MLKVLMICLHRLAITLKQLTLKLAKSQEVFNVDGFNVMAD